MKRVFCIFLLFLCIAVTASGESEIVKGEAILGEDGIQRIEVFSDNYYYKPNYIVVKAGIPVEMTIKKAGGITPHDFIMRIEEAGIHIEEDIPTEGIVIKFSPAVPGQFPFYCSKRFLFFKSHRDRGMEGILEVKP